MQMRMDEAMARGDPQGGDGPAALGSEDDGEPAVAAFRRSLAENDDGPAPDRRGETAAAAKTGRFRHVPTRFAFALSRSLASVAAVVSANAFPSSFARQLSSRGL